MLVEQRINRSIYQLGHVDVSQVFLVAGAARLPLTMLQSVLTGLKCEARTYCLMLSLAMLQSVLGGQSISQ